jgi:DNA-binding SARP family transcriptional activator
MSVENEPPNQVGRGPALQIRLFGPLTISRGGVAVVLPASRKVRALLAYLALAPRAVTRGRLCEFLWDVPNDPRGELRWCLSKLRGIVDEPGRKRIETQGDTIRLDLNGCLVDAVEVARATQAGITTLDGERLRALTALCGGDFLDGLEVDRSPDFYAWLTTQRRHFRGCHAALLERLVRDDPDHKDVLGLLEAWLRLTPFDPEVHGILLHTLARRGRLREGEEHLAATARLFEAEGLDHGELQEMWRNAKSTVARTPRPETAVCSTDAPLAVGDEEVAHSTRRASIAVMPFVDRSIVLGAVGERAAEGLAHDVITRLAKLRNLLVIAQGTVIALHERQIGPQEAGRMLNVDYIVSGSLRRQGKRLSVAVELSETRSARIVWAEVFDQKMDDALLVLDEIGNNIVALIASEIETQERNRAILKMPGSLDAWEAHHCGLWHMYRFNKADNERAQQFFSTAVRLDPTFSRAYAGLSFTHWQNVFQGWGNREAEIDKAYENAGHSLMADDRDPAAHWAMGRALWLRGYHDQSISELDKAIDLSPNFALGHYTRAFVHSQAGDPNTAIEAADYSRRLSPFDPLLFGMLAARAVALVRRRQFAEAAEWAVKAAARPNAHAHILAIAAYCLSLASRGEEARAYLSRIHETLPHYRVDDFLAAFQFDAEGDALFRRAGKRIETGR